MQFFWLNVDVLLMRDDAYAKIVASLSLLAMTLLKTRRFVAVKQKKRSCIVSQSRFALF